MCKHLCGGMVKLSPHPHTAPLMHGYHSAGSSGTDEEQQDALSFTESFSSYFILVTPTCLTTVMKDSFGTHTPPLSPRTQKQCSQCSYNLPSPPSVESQPTYRHKNTQKGEEEREEKEGDHHEKKKEYSTSNNSNSQTADSSSERQ